MAHDPLLTLVAQVLEVDAASLTEESGMNVTENWDSLRNMYVLMAVETQYDLRVDFSAYLEVTTIKGLRALLPPR